MHLCKEILDKKGETITMRGENYLRYGKKQD